MSPQNLVRTACKIFGLYLFVLAALSIRDVIFYLISFSLQSFQYREDAPIMLLPFYMLVFNTVAGLFLIFKADLIAHKLRAPANGYINIALERTDMIELVLIAISMIAILYSVPEMLHKLVTYAYFNDYDQSEKRSFWSDNNNMSSMLFSAFKFVAGLFLLLNARNFARRLRRAAQREDERSL